jgi:photosystem II stability/assembly factor-like uncharacterized protein
MFLSRLVFALLLLSVVSLSFVTSCFVRAANNVVSAPVVGSTMPHYGAWQSSRIGGGGWVQQVVFTSKPNLLYTYIDIGGLYRSDDGGKHWRMLHGNLPSGRKFYEVRGLVVHPKNPEHLLIATGTEEKEGEEPAGVFLSLNGGQSWKQVLKAHFYGNSAFRWTGQVLRWSQTAPNTVYAASQGNGVWVSNNAGLTWASLGLNNLYSSDLYLLPPLAQTLKAPAFKQVVKLEAAPTLKTVENGKLKASPTLQGSLKLMSTSITLADRLLLSALPFYLPQKGQNLQGGLFSRVSAASHWMPLTQAPQLEELLQEPWVNAQNGQATSCLVGLSQGSQVLRSCDAGHSWQAFFQGLPIHTEKAKQEGHVSEHRFYALASTPSRLLLASSRGRFYERRSPKEPWQALPEPKLEQGHWFARKNAKPVGWEHFGASASSISVDPLKPETHWFFTDWYALYETQDGGGTWTLRIDGIEATRLFALLHDKNDPNLVHLGMADNGYFRSVDGGHSFEQVQGGVSSSIRQIVTSPNAPNALYALGSSSRTAGQWVSNQLFVSQDKGLHWQEAAMQGLPALSERSCHSLAVDLQQHLWLAVAGRITKGQGGVYLSSDGGQNWQWQGQGLPTGEPFFTDSLWETGTELAAGLTPEREPALVAISHSKRAVFYWSSVQNQWLPSATAFKGQPFGVVAHPAQANVFYIGVEGEGLFVSQDTGQHWRLLRKGSVTYVAVDSQAGVTQATTHLIISTPTGPYFSKDGGQTWPFIGESLPDKANANMASLHGDHLIVGSAGSGAFIRELGVSSPKAH